MLLKDFVLALRTLRSSPAFTATAVITIALGIGASTAIFSVTNAVLLRPLPYRDADRLVLVCSDLKKRNVLDFPISNADFIDVRKGTAAVFDDVGAVVTNRISVPREDGTPEQVHLAVVTTNFFRLLGGRVTFGRDFIDSDGQPQAPAAPAVANAGAPAAQAPPSMAILSYEYWQRRFGGSTAILGHRMLSGGTAGPLVVGVLAPGFELLFSPRLNVERVPDLWIANRLAYDAANRANVSLRVIGRLKPGVSIGRAQDAVNLVAAELRRMLPIWNTAGYTLRLEPMDSYLVAEVRPTILALMGAVIFLLLIACSNVANLMLVRVSLRERDLAVRTALGGSRWRLVRQMLAEALALAGAGTIAGVGLAWAGIHELLVIAPANLPRLESISIDPMVLGFTALAGLAAAALFGITPALRASRPDVMQMLRGSGRTAGLRGGGLLRSAVVVMEVALSFVLLIGSGLMFRSFLELQRIDPGFDPHHLLTFTLNGNTGQKPEQRAATARLIHDRLGSIAGVQAVTAATPFPLTGGFSPIRWGTEQALVDPSKFQAVDFQVVLPGYFETMRTPLYAGRTFTDADNSPARNYVVVDQMLANKLSPDGSAIGKRILIRIQTPQPVWVEIIGVIGHQRETSLADAGREQIYFTDGYLNHGVASRWALRTASEPGNYSGAVRREIAKINPHLLITELRPMDVWVSDAQAGTRFSLMLIGVFAIIAGLLAAVGLYGVLSTVVRQRTAEIGLRMAIGAAPSNIFQLVVGHGLRLSAIGIGLGLVAAFALTRAIRTMLVGVRATDPITFATIAFVFFIVAAAASWVPAWRASGLDPTVALRQE